MGRYGALLERIFLAVLLFVLSIDVVLFFLGVLDPGTYSGRSPRIADPSMRLGLAVLALLLVPVGLALAMERSSGYVVAALLSTPVVVWYSVTSVVLPWDQFGVLVGQHAVEFVLAIPVVGKHLTQALFGGLGIGQPTLQLAYQWHYAIVWIAVLGVVYATLAGVRQPDTSVGEG